MKIRMKILISIQFVLVFCLRADAQLFDKLNKKTMDKLEQKAEYKIVEELSEEIARRAFKPIDKAMDDMLKSTY